MRSAGHSLAQHPCASSQSIGLALDASATVGHTVCRRFCALLEDGIIKLLYVEQVGSSTLSDDIDGEACVDRLCVAKNERIDLKPLVYRWQGDGLGVACSAAAPLLSEVKVIDAMQLAGREI